MKRLSLIAAFAGLAVSSAAAEDLSVAKDQSKVVKLTSLAATVVVGNPEIADVAMQDGTTAFVTGKGFGTTNVIAMDAEGRQIGIGWGWYMLSPDFGYLWPSESQPAAYGADDLLKIAVLMTDGEFNTAYCNGVVSSDSTASSSSNRINCNATNGDPFAQAAALCAGMKAEGVIVYTVGFDISDNVDVVNVLTNCATSPAHAKLADNGGDLKTVFRQIAVEISNLRVAR